MMTLQTLLTNACKDAKIANPETFTLKLLFFLFLFKW